MTMIPDVEEPVPVKNKWRRHFGPSEAFRWLAQGWRDVTAHPLSSLSYGVLICVLSVSIIVAMFGLGLDYVVLPAVTGFMIVGPLLPVGLYEKSDLLAAGKQASLTSMVSVKPRCGGQIFFVGVLLCLLLIAWMRAAVIIYALFFGLLPFPGLDHVIPMLTSTSAGWGALIVGSIVGAIFAAFSFAISVFSIPMMFHRNIDALTAMGSSLALVWNNLSVMVTWGAIVLAFSALIIATGSVAMIIIFPLLGHGTWHAYRAIAGGPR